MPAPAAVRMYDPNEDRVKDIHPDDVALAEQEGMLRETADETKLREYQKTAGIGQAALTGLEGAASGATLGLSDVVLSEALGDEFREGRKLRKETFGGIDTASTLGGAIVPVLLSGGAGTAASAARLTPTALAARAAMGGERLAARALARIPGAGSGTVLREALESAARLGVGGAIEGGIAGAGMALSEAALADELHGFDAVAERAWAGAQSGAMLGLFGGAALGGIAGAGVGASRGLRRRFGKNGDALAEAANERAVKALDVRGSDLRKLQTESKIQELGEDLRNYTLKDGTPVLDWTDNVQSLAPKVAAARQELGEELGRMRAAVAQAGAPPDAQAFVQRVRDEVITPLKASDSAAVRQSSRKVEREIATIATDAASGQPVPFERLMKYRADLQRQVYGMEKRMKGPNPPPAERLESLRRTERILDDVLDQHVETVLAKVAPDDVAKYQDTKRLYSSFAKADQFAQKSVGQNLGNRHVSLTDYMTGLTAGSALFDGGASVIGGMASAYAHKLARERGSALLATLYTRAKAVDARMTQGLNGFFQRARQAAKAGRVAATGQAIGSHVGFDTRRALRAAQNEREEDAYDRIVARAHGVVNGSTAGPMVVDDAAPETGHHMRIVQQRAATHLVRHAPVPPRKSNNPNLGALAGDAKPDPVSLYEFSRRVAAIDDPLSVLDDLRAGVISMASVEAIREVYPRLYAEMQARVIDGLGSSPDLLPYEERVRLGVLFDIPTDQTLRPEYLAATQAAYVQPPKPPAPNPLPAGKGPIARRAETVSQQLESGEAPA